MAPAPKDSGMGTQYEVPYVNSIVIACFLAIAWYNVLELTILIQTFFKRHSGLYYYSLLVANWGVFFHGLETLLKFFKLNSELPGHKIANTVIGWVGWVMMVTGQSVVLWSRLHLVGIQVSWTRWILFMIIFNAVVLHGVTGVLTFLTNISHHPETYKGPYSIIERIQVTLFFIQEVILSSIYIWKTTAMLRVEGPLSTVNRNVRGKRGRKVLLRTIVMSSIVICLDITLVALEFSGLYDIQTSYKDAVYSIKLKMEFTILNQLIDLVKGTLREHASLPLTTSGSHRYTNTTSGNQRSTIHSGIRSPGASGLGHSAGAYARMDDHGHGGSDFVLQSLKGDGVLKTTTTEVRIDRIERVSEDREREKARSPSPSSSEVYIIESNKLP
ncbi:hypothetical protein CC78DRAFT_521889 [Lojkania enalia]|uniref:DUF7703 domain-containing protein n=1 Tax=Lojkania enalia TaxID=147567 RepID=A0A9P4K3W5_9PLEO|nr:hypothetical protein CC78DRAFT_521889 [Didymosphaeria enalia]